MKIYFLIKIYSNKTTSSESLSTKIQKSIVNWNSFNSERSRIRNFLYNEFANLPDLERDKKLQETFEWASNYLRQRDDNKRFIALLVLSFLIEIDDDQNRLYQLSLILDKLLPLESTPLLKGVAYLYKRLSELITDHPILTRIIDRCIDFLSNRSTNSATQSAIIILLKVKPKTKLYELANVLWTAIKYPNIKIKKKAVSLYLMCLGHFIYSEDLLKTMMSMCTVCIQANSNPSETLGAFIVIRAFIERGYKIIDEKFSDILHSIGHFLLSNQDPQSF